MINSSVSEELGWENLGIKINSLTVFREVAGFKTVCLQLHFKLYCPKRRLLERSKKCLSIALPGKTEQTSSTREGTEERWWRWQLGRPWGAACREGFPASWEQNLYSPQKPGGVRVQGTPSLDFCHGKSTLTFFVYTGSQENGVHCWHSFGHKRLRPFAPTL